ncbi:galactose-3-O-sulfotransferase 2-like [Saccoglossus kowalevskii]
MGTQLDFELGTQFDFELGTQLDFELGTQLEFEMGTQLDFELGAQLDFEMSTLLDIEMGLNSSCGVLTGVWAIMPRKRFLRNVSTKCREVMRVVFIKTHKTASSTTASIFQRFGYSRNLSFVLPENGNVFSASSGFKRSMVNWRRFPSLNGGKHYDMLTNHVGYNRHEIEAIIPNATYVTVLRHPVNQLVSAFSYFQWSRTIKSKNGSNPDLLSTFMQSPMHFLEDISYGNYQGHNGQLHDLGFRTNSNLTDDLVYKYIEVLDREIDLVLITEYLDESLLILKNQLCWSMDDIVYISKGVAQSKLTITQNTRDKILRWNSGDLLLYEHFNRTLWEKIDAYGPTFMRDLQQFRDKLQEKKTECVIPSEANPIDPRVETYLLKDNAPEMCLKLWLNDMNFTKLIKTKQMHNFR